MKPLAIVGIGCLFPKAANVREFWSNIREGVDAISEIPDSHWKPEEYFDADPSAPDMTYARRGGFLSKVDFDPLLYGLSPNNIEATDTTQLLGMVIARQALLDAGYSTATDAGDGREFDRDRTSVMLGVTGTLELVIPLGARLGHPLWRQALKDSGVDSETAEDVIQRIADGYVPWQENSFPGLLGNVAAGRIANRFDLGGTNCVVDAACASSLSAIHMAAMELSAGRSDMCIAGGLDTFNDIFMYMCFSKTPALSPTGNSRPFDRDADGTILGEGLGALVLKRLEDAERDHDKIYAVIKGIGTSSDGRGNAIYAPSAAGQTKALRDCYAEAALTPDTIELVEAHGTGTKVGDAVELQALSTLYREHDAENTWCALGSVKSMIGHTKSAAGVAGLIKAAMALKHQVLPPTIKVEQPAEQVEPGRSPMYVNTRKRPWVANPDHPRRAAISAFGFGGSNFHCVLEEPGMPSQEIAWDGNVLLFGFSADTKTELVARLASLDPETDWASLRRAAAHSLQHFEPDQSQRLVIAVERDRIGLKDVIENSHKLITESDDNFWLSPLGACYACGAIEGSTAALFPGQGAQYVGMLRDMACQFPQLTATLTAANAGQTQVGSRTSDRIFPIPVFNDPDRDRQQAELTRTENAQPAIGAISLGAFRVLEHFGFDPEFTAGHSYGELVALCAAGRIDETTLHQLSRLRGELMGQGDGDRGGMLSIASDIKSVRELLDDAALDLVIANHNTPSQVIVSGASDQLDAAASACARLGLKHRKLEVSAAFHSEFVADAASPFADALQAVEIGPGTRTVMANVSGDCYPEEPQAARDLLAAQITSQVLYVDQIETLYELGVRTFVDVGPRNHASGMVRQILGDRDARVFNLDSPGGGRGQYHLACLVGALAALDSRIDLGLWDGGYLDSIEPVNSGRLTLAIDGANYRSPREPRPARIPTPQSQTRTMTTNQQEPVAPPAQTSTPNANPNGALEATRQSILALQKMQEQTANLHRQYLEGQETAQRTIAQLMEQQQRLLSGLPAAPPVVPAAIPVTPAEPATMVETPVSVVDQLETLSQSPEASPECPEIAETAAQRDHSDINNVLLEVVSDKTGYPMEMLSLDMSLDTDLGIDSIKRVEILSTLQERLPWAPTVSPEELGTFRFLQHIVEFLAAASGAELAATPAADIRSPGSSESATVAADGVHVPALSSTLLEVVADKTGYPVEMLNLEMSMETDLGIDSIKRVEILSALQECLPDMPAVKPEDLSRLQTLQQVVDHVSSVEPPATATVAVIAPAPTESRGLDRRVVRTVPLDTSDRVSLEIEDAPIWVAGPDDEMTRAICESFTARGLEARLVEMDARAETLGGLVVVAPEAADADFLEQAFTLIQSAGGALQDTDGDTFLAGVTALGGSFALDSGPIACDPVAAGLAGLIKTADKEWPSVACKVLDLSPAVDLAEVIVDECLTRGPLEVGLGESTRVQVELQAVELGVTEAWDGLQSGDVVIVSGGARGVTAEVSLKLAETFGVNLLLLGTRALSDDADQLDGLTSEAEIKKTLLQRAGGSATPAQIQQAYDRAMANREIRDNLTRFKAAGVNARYCALDVRDEQAVCDAVAGARDALGPIRGIVHGAGVLADRLIEDKTVAQFRSVYSTKVEGMQALLSATRDDPLRLMVMFSSSTARFGRKGQCDYAAANEVLNKLAQLQARERPDCRVLSVNWGPWDGGMVTPALSKVFAAEGVGVIPLDQGASYLMQEIAGNGPVELVVLGATDPQPAALPSNLQLAFEKSLSIDSMPVLAAHVMDGKAVLPMAIITEWLAHAAMHDNPGMSFQGFDDLKIFKGVTLESHQTLKLQVLAGTSTQKGNQDFVPVELRSGSILYARAEMVLAYELDRAGSPQLEPAVGAYTKAIYGSGELFHGAELQGIQRVLACSSSGMVADVKAAPVPAQWMTKPLRSRWQTDPLVLDASYQLMILWCFDQLGAGSLPTAVHRYRQYQRHFPAEGSRIVIAVTEQADHRAQATIEYLDPEGGLVARIDGYECVVDHSLAGAFSRNRLTSEA